MNWFGKSLKSLNSPVAAPASELQIDVEARALTKIRNMCAVATASAQSFAQSSHDDLARSEKQRFESAKRMSLELAKNITDVSYRDTALEVIVELCMKANDIDTARILVRGIQTAGLFNALY